MEKTEVKPYNYVHLRYGFNRAELIKMAGNRGFSRRGLTGKKEDIIRRILSAEHTPHLHDLALHHLLDKYPTKQSILNEYKKIGFKDAELANLARKRTRKSLIEGFPLSKAIFDELMRWEPEDAEEPIQNAK